MNIFKINSIFGKNRLKNETGRVMLFRSRNLVYNEHACRNDGLVSDSNGIDICLCCIVFPVRKKSFGCEYPNNLIWLFYYVNE